MSMMGLSDEAIGDYCKSFPPTNHDEEVAQYNAINNMVSNLAQTITELLASYEQSEVTDELRRQAEWLADQLVSQGHVDPDVIVSARY